MKKLSPLTLSIFSGLLLIASWPTSQLTFLIFIAWVPLLQLAGQGIRRNKFFLYCYLTFFIWNLGTTWWIWNASAPGSIAAFVVNPIFMCLPLWGYHVFKTKFGSRIGYISLIAFWMSFEYIHLNWQLSWPWLTLGNVFATNTGWVQWYEYTGTSGGSFWILIVNILILQLQKTEGNRRVVTKYAALLMVSGIPFLVSYLLYKRADQPVNPLTIQNTNVIIVQPNIDPYSEKFANGSEEGQIQKLISSSEDNLDSNTRLVIWPETAIPIAVDQANVENNPYCKPVFDFTQRHPQVTVLSGIETYKFYGQEKLTNTARKSGDNYYDSYNAAIGIKANEPFRIHNKSKLVPGAETLPDFLLWLGPIFEKFGGTTGGYGRDRESAVFKTMSNPYVAAPIICYESIYGEYVASYVRKGATLLAIITNDGWWFDTPGHRQHLNYARLRAIETRRWIARSANTGISAVIDNKGNLVQTRPWNKAAVIKYNIPALTGETFFVRNGDLLSMAILVIAGVLLTWNIVLVIKKRFYRPAK